MAKICWRQHRSKKTGRFGRKGVKPQTQICANPHRTAKGRFK